jgi:hypothetical protein
MSGLGRAFLIWLIAMPAMASGPFTHTLEHLEEPVALQEMMPPHLVPHCLLEGKPVSCDKPCADRDGTWAYTFERRGSNGMVADRLNGTITCEKSVRHGELKLAFPQGQTAEIQTWEMGRIVQKQDYELDGFLRWLTVYIDANMRYEYNYDKPGIWVGVDGKVSDRNYIENDQSEKRQFLLDDEPMNGTFTRKHAHTTGWMTFTLVDGMYHGTWSEFDQYGNRTRTLQFDHGKIAD